MVIKKLSNVSCTVYLFIFGYLLFKFISAYIFVLCLLVGDDPYFWTDDRQSVFLLDGDAAETK